MANLTLPQLRALASDAGFPAGSLDIAAAIAMAESGGNPNAVGDNGDSCGLWQVNTPSHPQYTCSELLDPSFNAKVAYSISQGGTNWKPWSTYNSGAYLAYYQPGGSVAMTRKEALGIGAAILALGGAIAYAVTTKPRARRVIRRRAYA